MLLRNIHTLGTDSRKDIRILNGKISRIANHFPGITAGQDIDLKGALVFPGLINSHDHLDFNLFPTLGHKLYANYREWGHDIQTRDKVLIDQVLNIPETLRTQWGIYKNLINGVTTVVNHGKHLAIENNLINVFQESHSYHSVGFEKNWRWKINRPHTTGWPIVLHSGEGIDDVAAAEVDELIRWNFFKKEIIAVHGTMMNMQQAEKFRALVWCPASNQFLLGKTAPVERLKNHTKILFGTDSTLSAGWNIWEQLRLARNNIALTDQELFDSLTSTAASVWRLKNTGDIKEDYWADLVITQARGLDDFYQINPDDLLLVMRRGNILLFDDSLFASLRTELIDETKFQKIYLDRSSKFIAGDISGLVSAIRKYHKGAKFPLSIEANLHTEVL